MNSKTLIVRKTNGTFRLAIPSEWVRDVGLAEGDVLVWTPVDGHGGAHLRLLKVATAPELLERPPPGGDAGPPCQPEGIAMADLRLEARLSDKNSGTHYRSSSLK
jgi:hypothetical protein